MNSATESMEQIHRSTNECKEIVWKLGEESKEILGIIQVITGISQQTNILALNATIELQEPVNMEKVLQLLQKKSRSLQSRPERLWTILERL